MANPGGMAGLDRVKRQNGCDDRTGIESGRLPLEKCRGQVLECDRRLHQSCVVLRHAPVVKRRAGERLASKQAPDRRCVCALVCPNDPREGERSRLDRAEALGLGVEAGLEILEREIESLLKESP